MQPGCLGLQPGCKGCLGVWGCSLEEHLGFQEARGGGEGLTARRLEARGRGGGRQQDAEEVILGWDVMGWDG